MLINSCVGRVAREFGDPLALLLNIEFRGGLGEGRAHLRDDCLRNVLG